MSREQNLSDPFPEQYTIVARDGGVMDKNKEEQVAVPARLLLLPLLASTRRVPLAFVRL